MADIKINDIKNLRPSGFDFFADSVIEVVDKFQDPGFEVCLRTKTSSSE